MSQENERAAQRAHENARRPPDHYDDEGRPVAARARDAEHGGAPPRGRQPAEDGRGDAGV